MIQSKFSNNHLKKSKNKKGQNEINFNNILYLTYIQKYCHSTCNQYKYCLQNLVCILYIQHMSIQSRHIYALNSHIRVGAAIFDNITLASI